jgi:hypothetical protein
MFAIRSPLDMVLEPRAEADAFLAVFSGFSDANL